MFNGFKVAFLLAFVFVSLLTSCTRRPLEEEWETNGYAEILLVTDWQKLLPYETPTGLTAIFYPEDGSNPVTVMSNNTKQNVVRLRRGRYKAVVFNQSIYEFGSMNFTDMTAFATATANLNPLTAGNTLTAADFKWLGQVINDPDSVALGMREPEFFHADRFEYEVTEELCMKQYYKDTQGVGLDVPVWDVPEPTEYVDTIFSTPPPVPPTLHVKARVRGIHNAYQVRAYITNMALSDRFGPHVNPRASAIHVLSNWALTPDSDNKKLGTFTGSTRCFGVPTQIVTHNPFNALAAGIAGSAEARSGSRRPAPVTLGDYGRNILFFDILLRDGRTHRTFAFDVTDHIVYTEDLLRLDLELNIDDYPSRPDGTGGGGSGEGVDPDDPSGPDYPIVLPDVPDIIGAGGAGFDATVEDWKNEEHTIRF